MKRQAVMYGHRLQKSPKYDLALCAAYVPDLRPPPPAAARAPRAAGGGSRPVTPCRLTADATERVVTLTVADQQTGAAVRVEVPLTEFAGLLAGSAPAMGLAVWSDRPEQRKEGTRARARA